MTGERSAFIRGSSSPGESVLIFAQARATIAVRSSKISAALAGGISEADAKVPRPFVALAVL